MSAGGRGRSIRLWIQVAALALILALELVSFATSRGLAWPWLSRAISPIDRLGYWHFFTTTRRAHVEFAFEGFDGASWRELPMEAWFPARWESGPRWNAIGWSHDVAIPRLGPGRKRAIAQAFLDRACQRSGLLKTRLVERVWPKRLGEATYEASAATSKALWSRDCDR